MGNQCCQPDLKAGRRQEADDVKLGEGERRLAPEVVGKGDRSSDNDS